MLFLGLTISYLGRRFSDGEVGDAVSVGFDPAEAVRVLAVCCACKTMCGPGRIIRGIDEYLVLGTHIGLTIGGILVSLTVPAITEPIEVLNLVEFA